MAVFADLPWETCRVLPGQSRKPRDVSILGSQVDPQPDKVHEQGRRLIDA